MGIEDAYDGRVRGYVYGHISGNSGYEDCTAIDSYANMDTHRIIVAKM